MGQIDAVGLLLALAVLLWIPTHILTFGLKYAADYRRVGVPVFPKTHAEGFTRAVIGLSTAGAVAAMLLTTYLIGLSWGFWRATFALSVVLLGVTPASVLRRSPKLNFALFKMASLYMLGSMGLIMVRVLKPNGFLIYSDLIFPSWLAAIGKTLAGGRAGFPTKTAIERLVETHHLRRVHYSPAVAQYEAIFRKLAG